MKRLFQINKPNGEQHTFDDGVMYFSKKETAKKVRDGLNRDHPNGGYTVGIGPDHKGKHSRRGRTHTRARRTHQE